MSVGASTLGSDEVDKMVAEAEKFSEEDKQKREEIDVRNSVCLPSLRSLFQLRQLPAQLLWLVCIMRSLLPNLMGFLSTSQYLSLLWRVGRSEEHS